MTNIIVLSTMLVTNYDGVFFSAITTNQLPDSRVKVSIFMEPVTNRFEVIYDWRQHGRVIRESEIGYKDGTNTIKIGEIWRVEREF